MTTEKLHHIGADLYLPNDFAEYDMPTEYDGLSVSVTIHWDSASAEHRLIKSKSKAETATSTPAPSGVYAQIS